MTTCDLHFYSVMAYEKELFPRHNPGLKIILDEEKLTEKNYPAKGTKAICIFVEDLIDANGMKKLSELGVKGVLLRSKGFDYVDHDAAKQLGIKVMHTFYGPTAIVEHTVGLITALARRLKPTMMYTSKLDFRVDELLGPMLRGKTLGIIGTGLIGKGVVDIMTAFGMTILACDPYPNKDLVAAGVPYVSKEEVIAKADVLTLHCPYTPETGMLLDAKAFASMRDGVIVVNTARKQLIDLPAALAAVESGKVSGLGLDVFDHEEDIVFKVHSSVPQDIMKMLNHPNIILTNHQAYLSRESVETIATMVFENYSKI